MENQNVPKEAPDSQEDLAALTGDAAGDASSISKKKWLVVSIVSLVFIVIGTAVIFVIQTFYNESTAGKHDGEMVVIDTPRVVDDTPIVGDFCSQTTYVYRGEELNISDDKFDFNDLDEAKIKLLLDPETNLEGLLESGESLYSPHATRLLHEKNLVAFITSVQKDGKGFRKVQLYNLVTKELETVYELETEIVGNVTMGKDRGINSIGFSENGELLAITTGVKFKVYNLNTGEITAYLEENPVDTLDEESFLYGYYEPKFSADGLLLYMGAGFYEGSGARVYDFKKDQLVDLDYFSYVSGKNVVGWYGNKLFFEEYEFVDDDMSNYEYKFHLVSDPTGEKDEELIASLPILSLSFIELVGDSLYFVSDESEPSGIEVCNNVGDPYEVTTEFATLNALNMKTGNAVELFKVDSTYSIGVEDSMLHISKVIVMPIDGEPVLIVGIRHARVPYDEGVPIDYYVIEDIENVVLRKTEL